MDRIYLDNAASTKIDSQVVKAINDSYSAYGNPSSLHSFGQDGRRLMDQSRDTIASFLNCKPTEVIFTSGGSESDNLAIKGLVEGLKKENSADFLPHIIISAIEHHAILHTVQDLEKEGKIEATYVKPNKFGIIQVPDIKKAIKSNTILVSVMYANNEIGTVQPIREIGKMIEKENEKKEQKIYFHTDAVQAAGFAEMNTKYLHVDLLTLTAHKIHGPRGIGLLFVKKGTPLLPQIIGGEHEFRLRAGTENVPGIVGLAEAIKQVEGKKLENENIAKLRDKLENGILKTVPKTYLNGDKELRSPSISNISFENAEGEAIILNLDFLGIAVSSGSACTARSLEPSHVLLAIGLSHELSHGAIRFSLSNETTEADIDRVLEVMPGIIKKIREMSPFN